MADHAAARAERSRSSRLEDDRARRAPAPTSRPRDLLDLQRAAGNQAVLGALDGGDRLPPSVRSLLADHRGEPLDRETRATMERRFRRDFGGVRIHADAVAGESARLVGARAYTVGSDVVFGSGRYAPKSREGQRLLAHELAHVVQQADAPAEPATGSVARPDLEGNARGAGERVAAGRAAGVIPRAPGVGIQREEDPAKADEDKEQDPLWVEWYLKGTRASLDLVPGMPGPLASLWVALMRGVVREVRAQSGKGDLWDQLRARFGDVLRSPLQFFGRYLWGFVKGFFSPITGLFDLAKLAYQLQQLEVALVAKVLAGGDALAKDLEELAARLGAFTQSVREAFGSLKLEDVVSLFSGAGSGAFERQVTAMGRSAAGKMFGLVREPWTAQMAETIGRVVGEVVVNVLLFVFTEGIGNAITQVTTWLGRIASKLPLGARALVQVIEWIGEAGAWITRLEEALGVAIAGILKPFEKILKPLFDLLGSLRAFLRRLFGVADQAAARGVEAAATAGAGTFERPPVGAPRPIEPRAPGPPAEAPRPAPARATATPEAPPLAAKPEAPAPIGAPRERTPASTPSPRAQTAPPAEAPTAAPKPVERPQTSPSTKPSRAQEASVSPPGDTTPPGAVGEEGAISEIEQARLEEIGEKRRMAKGGGLVDEEFQDLPPHRKPYMRRGERMPGRQQVPPGVKRWARATSREEFEQQLYDALRGRAQHTPMTLKSLEYMSPEQIRHVLRTGKLPPDFEFHHLQTVADDPIFAHRPEAGLGLPKDVHRGAGHAGDPTRPVEAGTFLDPGYETRPPFMEDPEAVKYYRPKQERIASGSASTGDVTKDILIERRSRLSQLRRQASSRPSQVLEEQIRRLEWEVQQIEALATPRKP